MSEQQPQPRGGFRGRGPRGDRGGRAGAHSNRAGAQKSGGGDTERPKKENILDLSKYLNKALRVKFSGGREVTGILKGFDQLMNLVLDDVKETLRDEEGNESTRELGLTVARAPLVTLISPVEGMEEIANPFLGDED